MDMKKFVHGRDRAASPNDYKNSQRINPERRAIAANAKVTLRKAPPTVAPQIEQPHVLSGLPSRGFGNVQNTSAAVQHDSRRRHADHDHQPDAFDTDAESLDTTIDQSFIQAEPGEVKDVAVQLHDHVAGLDSDGLTNEDDAYDESDEIEYEEQEVDLAQYVLKPEDHEYLQQHGQQQLSREEAIDYLFQHRPETFQTVKGDSYPSTTDGQQTEWNGKAEPNSEGFDDDGPASPSLPAGSFNRQPPLTPPSMRRGLADEHAERSDRHPNKLFQQSAHLRDQQRGSRQPGAPLQSSQPPSYSQAVPTQRPSTVRNKVVPVIQHQIVDLIQPQSSIVASQGDYDFDALKAMQYEQLKREDFDHNPRAPPHLLSDNMQQKPLTERLEHVQHNFDAGKQSQFFSALPTTEWEDAGDWFLEQFSSIIQRTKDARQNKRKLAQGFEDEIEKRHEHVSKKQRQVEDAMHKMQTQGEGLMPRSPRASRSPKTKKR